jgi:hypothetical protein
MHAVKKNLEAVKSKLAETFDKQRSMREWMVHAPLGPFLRLGQQAQCVTREDDAICMREQVPQKLD